MDFAYSPHRTGGTLHMQSPTHAHHYDQQLAAINKIRRSLSRSPSRSQLQINTAHTPGGSPRSPLAPFALTTSALTPAHSPVQSGSLSATSASPTSEFPSITASKKKFVLRRTAGFRSSPRINQTPRSPMRRALSENSNQGNITPAVSRRLSQEDAQGSENRRPIARRQTTARSPQLHLDIKDTPIRFEFAQSRSKSDSNSLTADFDLPAKSSPLKRDVEMNMDGGCSGSPNPKRRSIHSTIFGSDADFFSQATNSSEAPEVPSLPDQTIFSTSTSKRLFDSPVRRPLSLRRSTLQQRQNISQARPKFSLDSSMDTSGSMAPPSPAQVTRSRKSLEHTVHGLGLSNAQSPMQRPSIFAMPAPMAPARQPHQRSNLFGNHPHPLSQAVTSSSSSSNFSTVAESPIVQHQARLIDAKPLRPQFTRSLPIGATRPNGSQSNSQSTEGSFATPESFKMARPLPAAFMSTGLLSKRNRDVDFANNDQFAAYAMPDTPSKRNSFPPVASPIGNKSALRPRGQPVFGRASSPFGTPAQKTSPIPFGKRSNIFGNFDNHSLQRQSSFASIDGDDENTSPTAHRQHSLTAADDLPPTPTKPAGKPKENSLRSSLFGRRVSLGPDTFMPPPGNDLPSPTMVRTSKSTSFTSPTTPERAEKPPRITLEPPTIASLPGPKRTARQANLAFRTPFKHPRAFLSSSPSMPFPSGHGTDLNVSATPVGQINQARLSPHTPQDSFMPPDPSTLSISGSSKFSASAFKSSIMSNSGFPPATPTAPRDHVFPFGPAAAHVIGVTHNDVDTNLTSRFTSATVQGIGEFSTVYKVEKTIAAPLNPLSPHAAPPSVWAVKKTKKAYTGHKDRENKMREVEVLRALRGNDHVINLVDSWEAQGHLYIQTEYCEDGNLKDFLSRTGYQGRLDEFRIWKILLEASLGLKHIHDQGFIHLDLKPANIFIDFEGVLKIGDFGLATPWPARSGVEMEGDRQYIGPEVLHGCYDKPVDIFALGMILLEIAGNIVLPDNGVSWQRLRQGDMSDLPSLTWSSDASLPRNVSGEPIRQTSLQGTSFLNFDDNDDNNGTQSTERSGELIIPPNFMVDPEDAEALHKIVQWMIFPNPEMRPTVDQLLNSQGVQWVAKRRRSGATIYEGNWGPSDDVLGSERIQDAGDDVDMMDV